MRSKNIEITMKIPIPIGKPDHNGITYEKQAVIEAYKDVAGKPIVIYKNGKSEVVGAVIGNALMAEDDEFLYATMHGLLYYGGTEEETKSTDGKVDSMSISAFGLTV